MAIRHVASITEDAVAEESALARATDTTRTLVDDSTGWCVLLTPCTCGVAGHCRVTYLQLAQLN